MSLHNTVRIDYKISPLSLIYCPLTEFSSYFAKRKFTAKIVFCQLSHVEISVMSLLNWPTTFLLLCHFASLDRTSDSFVSDVGVIVYNNEKLIYFLIFHFLLGYLDNPCSTQINQSVSVCVYMLKRQLTCQ